MGQGEVKPKATELISKEAEEAAQGQAQPQLRRHSLTPAPRTPIVSSKLAGQGTGSFCRNFSDQKASVDGLWVNSWSF